jgi:hypothetical protein
MARKGLTKLYKYLRMKLQINPPIQSRPKLNFAASIQQKMKNEIQDPTVQPTLMDFRTLEYRKGISRGKARQLIADGLIKVLELPSYNQFGDRAPKKKRIMIITSSVDKYLESLAAEQNVSLD